MEAVLERDAPSPACSNFLSRIKRDQVLRATKGFRRGHAWRTAWLNRRAAQLLRSFAPGGRFDGHSSSSPLLAFLHSQRCEPMLLHFIISFVDGSPLPVNKARQERLGKAAAEARARERGQSSGRGRPLATAVCVGSAARKNKEDEEPPESWETNDAWDL